jgi:lysophospholipase L1-like esterase
VYVLQYIYTHPKKTILALALIIFAILLVMTDMFRFMKTLFLIARVTPYEQVGTGAGTIQFLGDSTGYGTGASQGKYSIAGRVGADYPAYTIKNHSVNGRTIKGLLTETQNFSGQYDLIVLQIGGNDILQKRDTSTVLSELATLLKRLAPHTKEIIMLTSGNIGETVAFSGAQATEYETLTRAYRAGVLELAQQTPHFTYVDLFDEPENDPFAKKPDIYTSIDDLHPSNQGYGLWYQKAKDTFATIL